MFCRLWAEVVVVKQLWCAVGCFTPSPRTSAKFWFGESETESSWTTEVTSGAASYRPTSHCAHTAACSARAPDASHTTLKVCVLQIEVHRVCLGVTVITARIRALPPALDYVPEYSNKNETPQQNADDDCTHSEKSLWGLSLLTGYNWPSCAWPSPSRGNCRIRAGSLVVGVW